MSEAYNVYMPSAAEFNDLILGISASLYSGQYAPTKRIYDRRKPHGWPIGLTLLKALGYTLNAAGWREFMTVMVGLPVPRRGRREYLAAQSKQIYYWDLERE